MSRKQISRSMSLSNVNTPELKDRVMDDVTQDDETKPHYFKNMSKYTIVLIDFYQFPDNFRQFLKENILDTTVKADLESQGIINWCRTMKPLFPLKTKGDGNCLLHAVSLAMWGVHDSSAFLRRLLLVALVNDGEHGASRFRDRWQKARCLFNQNAIQGGIHYDTQDWENEWHQVLSAATDVKKQPLPNQTPYDFLEDIHIFVLANILRRPIIILGESVIRSLNGSTIFDNSFPGIYLPLLWDPVSCVQSPIVLGYTNSHFVPLIGMENGSHEVKKMDPECAVPLVTKKLENLILHFLNDKEEKEGYVILKKYLNVMEINWTRSDSIQFVPCAKLRYERFEQFDLVKDHVLYLQKVYIKQDRKSDKIRQLKDSDKVSNIILKKSQKVADIPLENDETVNFNTIAKQKTVEIKKKVIDSSESDSEIKPLNVENCENGQLDGNVSTAIEHICKVNKCNYFVTALTYPYCSTHKRKRSNSASLDDTVNLDEKMDEVKLMEEKHNRNSINGKQSNFQETSQPCQSPGCNMYGLLQWGYMCSIHRRPMKSPKGKTNDIQKHIKHNANDWHKCRSPNKGCKGQGQAHLSGQCKDCFLCYNKGNNTYETLKCKNPVCDHFGSPEFDNYCSKCILDVVSTNQGNIKQNEVSLDDRLKMNSMEILGLLPGRSPSEMKHAREFYKCKFHDCRKLSTENTLGFCSNHFVQMYKLGRVNIPTSEEVVKFKQDVNEKRNKSAKQKAVSSSKHGHVKFTEKKPLMHDENCCCSPGCNGIRCYNKYGLCYFCNDAQMHGTQINQPEEAKNVETNKAPGKEDDTIESAAPESSSSSFDNCKGPRCPNKGKHTLKGLCESCYEILAGSHIGNIQVMEPLPQLVEHSPLKMRLKKCKTPGCDMYGTEPQMGYCSKCFTIETGEALKQQRQRRQEQERLNRLQLMTEAEVMNELPLDRTTGYPHMCLTPACDLYGDAVFRGFCSKCAEKRGILQPNASRQLTQNSALDAHCRMIVETTTGQSTEENFQPQQPLLSEDPTGYKRMMLEVESQTRSHQRCKEFGCENYGSSKNKGHCSTCYARMTGSNL